MAHPDEMIGPYTLVRKIGQGSFGVVWLAEKRTPIATTCFALKLARDEDVEIEAFKQEAAVWVRASGHPNVLTMIEADVYDGQIVIVSEYTPDGSLKNWLQRYGGRAPSIEAAVEMALYILAGLEHLHEQKIIHRDIKPDNILLQRGMPRLADFGIARLLRTDSYSQAVKGTLLYMAPEAFNRKRNEQTDVWSAGVVLYQMLSGHLPYDEPDVAALIGAILTREPSPLPESIPASLRRIVDGALQRDPSIRYQSAAEMRESLLAFRREMWQPSLPPTLADEPPDEMIQSQHGVSPVEVTASPSDDRLVTPSTDAPAAVPMAEVKQPSSSVMLVEQPQPSSADLSQPAPDMTPALSFAGMKKDVRANLQTRRKTALIGASVITILALLIWGLLHWRTVTQQPTETGGTQAEVPNAHPSEASHTPTTSAEVPQPAIKDNNWVYKQTLTGHSGDVNVVAYSLDGKTLASGSTDKTIKLWDTQTGVLKKTLTGIGYKVRVLAFSNTILASGSQSYPIKLWDAQTGVLQKTLNGILHPNETKGTVLALAFSPDGMTLASGSCDGNNNGKIRLWDAQTGALKKAFDAHKVCVMAAAFSPDGTVLATGGDNVKLWDPQTGALEQTFTVQHEGIAEVAFSPDGKTLAGAGCDKTIKLWDIQSGTLKQSLTGHNDCVMSVKFSPDGTMLVSGGKDKTIKLWDAQTGALLQTLTGHSGRIWRVAFSPDGKTLVSGSEDKTVMLWQLQS